MEEYDELINDQTIEGLKSSKSSSQMETPFIPEAKEKTHGSTTMMASSKSFNRLPELQSTRRSG